MRLFRTLKSFFTGIPVDAPDWKRLKEEGKTNNELRLAKLHREQMASRLWSLRVMFPRKVRQLRDDILRYGAPNIMIHYSDWPIRGTPDEMDELKRLSDHWGVEVVYRYPYYFMKAADPVSKPSSC